MATIRKTITFTKQQDAWIKEQVQKGDFTNDSEYIRDLVRRDQANSRRKIALDAALLEGMESGASDKSISDIFREAENKWRSEDRL